MKIVIALFAAFLVAPATAAFAQGVCPQEFNACLNKCQVPSLMDRCVEGCQQKNTACAAAVWNKPAPSYQNLTRPENPNAPTPVVAAEPEPATEKPPVQAKRQAEPKRDGKRQAEPKRQSEPKRATDPKRQTEQKRPADALASGRR